MSEPIIEYREEFNVIDIARKYTERIARVIDEQTLANVEDQLAGYGYVKVVRCRDCEFYYPKEGAMLSCKFEYHNFTQWRLAKPDGFCAWAVKRKEGGE